MFWKNMDTRPHVQGRYKTLITAFKKNERSQHEVWKWSSQVFFSKWAGRDNGGKAILWPRSNLKPNISTNASSSDEQLGETESSDKINESCSQKKKRKTASADVIDFLKEYAEEQREEKKAESDERKAMFEQKMDMMKMLIDVLKKWFKNTSNTIHVQLLWN